MNEYPEHMALARRQSIKQVGTIAAVVLALAGVMYAFKQDGRGRFLQKASVEELLKEFRTDPSDDELALVLGKRLITDGRYDEAFDVMSKLVKHNGSSAPIWKGYAMAAAGSGHVIASLNANLKVAQLSPRYAMGHATAGTILIQAGLIDEGLEEIDRARAIQSDVRLNVSVWAQALASRGKYSEAYEALRKSLNVDPTQDTLYEFLVQLAPRVGKYDEVVSMMLTRIKLSPMYDLYAVRAPLSTLLLSHGRDPETLDHALYYAQAAAKCGLPKAQVPVARAYLAMRNTADALKAVQTGLKQDPKDHDCLAMLAEIKDLLGAKNEAAAIRTKLGELSPEANRQLNALSESALASADPAQKRKAAAELAAHDRFAAAAELYRQLGGGPDYDSCKQKALMQLEAKEMAEAHPNATGSSGQ